MDKDGNYVYNTWVKQPNGKYRLEPVCIARIGEEGVTAEYPGRKEKKFCSDACRNKWWNTHLHLVNRKAMYEFVCPVCGKPFTAYGNRNRKYCSHECYSHHQ